METVRDSRLTEEEYLALERRSEIRHEFVNGELVDMAGSSPAHSAITANVIAALTALLRGKPCRVYTSDLRIAVSETGLYAYPDATVVCGSLQRHPKDPETITNPMLIVEVLSPSTESYDRGAKFAHYQRLPLLQEYMLVSQGERRVEHYRRLEHGQWLYTERTEGPIELPALGGALSLADLYDKVDLSAEPKAGT